MLSRGNFVIKIRGVLLIESKPVRVGRAQEHPAVVSLLFPGVFSLREPPMVNRVIQRLDQNV